MLKMVWTHDGSGRLTATWVQTDGITRTDDVALAHRLPADNLVRRIALDPLRARVPTAHTPLAIQHADRIILHTCHQGAKALFAFAEHLLLFPALNPLLGYEATAEIVKRSVKTGESLRSILEADGRLSPKELDRALDVMALTKGGVTRQ